MNLLRKIFHKYFQFLKLLFVFNLKYIGVSQIKLVKSIEPKCLKWREKAIHYVLLEDPYSKGVAFVVIESGSRAEKE